MILVTCLISIGMLLCFVISLPIRVDFDSVPALVTIRWLFVSSKIRWTKGSYQITVAAFGKTIGQGKRQKGPPSAGSTIKKRKKKKLRALNLSLLVDVLCCPAVIKSIRTLVRFGVRFFKAIQIKRLHWELGLQDYYWQGIVHGATACFAENPAFRISSNYQGNNRFELHARISLWRLLYAVLLLLGSFPYRGIYRLYRSSLLVG